MSCNFTIPGVEAFAYDLVAARGPVSGRVALLLRSTEGKPSCALAFFERNLPFASLACQGLGGGRKGLFFFAFLGRDVSRVRKVRYQDLEGRNGCWTGVRTWWWHWHMCLATDPEPGRKVGPKRLPSMGRSTQPICGGTRSLPGKEGWPALTRSTVQTGSRCRQTLYGAGAWRGTRSLPGRSLDGPHTSYGAEG